MRDLFSNLLQRSRGEDVLSPALPSGFAPVAEVEPWGQAEEVASPRARVPQQLEMLPVEPLAEAHVIDAKEPQRAGDRSELGERVAASDSTLRPPSTEDRPWQPQIEPPAQMTTSFDLAAIVAEALRQQNADISGLGAPEPAERRAELLPSEPVVPPSATEPPVEPVRTTPASPKTDRDHRDRIPSPAAIEVRIGRIEVTASPAPAPRPAPSPRVERVRPPSVSLADYLARRGRR